MSVPRSPQVAPLRILADPCPPQSEVISPPNLWLRPISFTFVSVSKSPVSGLVTVVVVVSVVVVVVVVVPVPSFCVVSTIVLVDDSKVPGVQSPITPEAQFVPSAS